MKYIARSLAPAWLSTDAPGLLRLFLGVVVGVSIAGWGLTGRAQTPVNAASEADVRAEQQYNTDVAACNSGSLPAPQRDRCIREAGLRLDYQRGLPGKTENGQTSDGRATVMTPSSASTALRGSTTATSDDGRATVVVPETAAP